MFRINSIPEAEAEGSVKKNYDELKESMGIVPNVFKVLSLCPDAQDAYIVMIKGTMFADTKLARAVKEMIAATVSRINQCDYCVGHHKNFMIQYGVSSAISEEILHDPQSADISDAEKKLLSYVENVTRHAYKVTDADVAGLKETGWSDEQILEATLVASLFNSINRFVDALGVQPEA